MATNEHSRMQSAAASVLANGGDNPLRVIEAPTHLDLLDRCDEKLSQAEALSYLLYGERGEAFRCLNDDIQDRVMWLLSSTISEAREAFEAMDVAREKVRHGQ